MTKIPCGTGVMVSASSDNIMYRHMVMALFTYYLSSLPNLHLILGNFLLLVRLDVGPWPRVPNLLALALGPKSLLTLTVY